MIPAEMNVTCPYCGSATVTADTAGGPLDRLKGNVENCPRCEEAFDLYYY